MQTEQDEEEDLPLISHETEEEESEEIEELIPYTSPV